MGAGSACRRVERGLLWLREMRIEPWVAAPEAPVIEGGEAHVWLARLKASEEDIARAAALLSAEEEERARRFRFERHRRRFVMAHAALRTILGRYLGASPGEVAFRHGPRGKPYLNEPEPRIQFNLAHSGELALAAITKEGEIGADIEIHRGMPEGVARRFFSAAENAALTSLPPRERERAFFRCWTRKEAFLKATGEGLSFGLDNFTVSLLPDEPAALLDLPGGASEASRWSMANIAVADNCSAAITARAHLLCIRRWRFD